MLRPMRSMIPRATTIHGILRRRFQAAAAIGAYAPALTLHGKHMKRIVVAVTGASGVLYGIRALELLRQCADVETHLILSPAAIRTIRAETAYAAADVEALADVRHAHKDIGASIASGSFQVDGMLVAPCSVKTLSGIANCFSDDLVTRAADVQLKERRRVVLLFRETPLHAGHIDLMARATASGAILMPPVPAFYSGITTLDEAATQTVGRALDLLGIDVGVVRRWQGQAEPDGTS